ncbi:MAG: LacI family DNA-binding transcriptional regulator [Bacillota bacterium]
MAKYTIKEIAELAGVSIATVSRVINDSENVSEEMREKVQKVIKETGFTPNSLARSLKVNKTNTIGVIVVNLNVPFFAHIVHYLERALRSQGYILMVACHHDQPDLERQCVEAMVEMQVEAIVITSTGSNDDYLAKIFKSGIPVLMLDRHSRDQSVPAIISDKKEGFYQLMVHLYELGHRKFTLVTGDRKITSNHSRFLGITNFLYDHNLPMDSVTCYYGEFSEEYGYEIARKIFALPFEERPTALLAGSSLIAIGVLMYCQEQNIKIPEQLSLTSLGDSSYPSLIKPTLTYMDDLRKEMSQIAAEKISKIMSLDERQKGDIILPSRIIIGQSTGIPPKA